MKSKSWNSIGRWIIYGLLLIVFVGPYWGIIATAFSGAPVKPGELLAWPNQFSWDNFIFAWMDIGVWQYLLNSIIVVFFGTVLQVSVSALAAYALARKSCRGLLDQSDHPFDHDAAGRSDRHSFVYDHQLATAGDRCLAVQQLSGHDPTDCGLGLFYLCIDRIYGGNSKRAGRGGAH